MQSFSIFKACQEVRTIEDINSKFRYKDEVPQGEGDSPLVACGQSDKYNELQYIYDTKLEHHVSEGRITKQKALTALCSACFELDNPRQRKDFYDYLAKELEIEI